MPPQRRQRREDKRGGARSLGSGEKARDEHHSKATRHVPSPCAKIPRAPNNKVDYDNISTITAQVKATFIQAQAPPPPTLPSLLPAPAPPFPPSFPLPSLPCQSRAAGTVGKSGTPASLLASFLLLRRRVDTDEGVAVLRGRGGNEEGEDQAKGKRGV